MIRRKFLETSYGRTLNELQRLCSQVKRISTVEQIIYPFTQSDSNLHQKFLSKKNGARSLHSSCVYDSKYGYKIDNALDVLEKYKLYCDSQTSQTILEQDPQTESLNSILGKPWSGLNNSDLMSNFEALSHCAHSNNEEISDPKYHEVLSLISSRLSTFSDDELHHLLDCLELWTRDHQNETYKEFYQSVDHEFIQRYRSWDLERLFLTQFKFFKLDLSRRSKFFSKSLKKLGSKVSTMKKSELVQFGFSIHISKWADVHMYNFEHAVEQLADEFTIDELGVIALAFSKYGTPLRSRDLITKIMQKLNSNIQSVSDFGFVSIFQMLRYIHDPNLIKELNKLLHCLETEISNRNLIVVAECMNLQRKTLCENKGLTIKAIERLEKEIESASIRVVYTILSSLTTLNYDPKTTPIYSIAVNKLLSPDRAKEIERYGHTFNEILVNLSYVDFYSKEALSRTFRKEVVNTLCAEEIWNIRRDYLALNEYVEIEHPDYDGPRVEEAVLKRISKVCGSKSWTMVNINLRNFAYKLLLKDTSRICQLIFGPDLPIHMDTPFVASTIKIIILCQDGETKEFISPTEKLSSIPRGVLKYAPNDGNRYFALLMGTYNLTLRSTVGYSGKLAQQVRQTKAIGYTPIVIDFVEWIKMNDEEKQVYVKRLLDI